MKEKKQKSLSFYIETRVALIIVVLILGALALIFVGGTENLKIVDIATEERTVRVYAEVADEPSEWQEGLMNRRTLNEQSGMLFVFDEEGPRTFWMKNTLIPLDMIFVAQNLTIVDIATMQPCTADPCQTYTSSAPALYVLEVNAGFAERNRIETGDTVVLDA